MYGLVDTEGANYIGVYPSLDEALRVVADAARRLGTGAPELASLALAREDGPAEDAFVAAGAELVCRALAATSGPGLPTAAAPPVCVRLAPSLGTEVVAAAWFVPRSRTRVRLRVGNPRGLALETIRGFYSASSPRAAAPAGA